MRLVAAADGGGPARAQPAQGRFGRPWDLGPFGLSSGLLSFALACRLQLTGLSYPMKKTLRRWPTTAVGGQGRELERPERSERGAKPVPGGRSAWAGHG